MTNSPTKPGAAEGQPESYMSIALRLEPELEKAKARIAELEAQLAFQRELIKSYEDATGTIGERAKRLSADLATANERAEELGKENARQREIIECRDRNLQAHCDNIAYWQEKYRDAVAQISRGDDLIRKLNGDISVADATCGDLRAQLAEWKRIAAKENTRLLSERDAASMAAEKANETSRVALEDAEKALATVTTLRALLEKALATAIYVRQGTEINEDRDLLRSLADEISAALAPPQQPEGKEGE